MRWQSRLQSDIELGYGLGLASGTTSYWNLSLHFRFRHVRSFGQKITLKQSMEGKSDHLSVFQRNTRLFRVAERLRLFYYGILLVCFGAVIYFAGIFFSLVRIIFFFHDPQLRIWNAAILWYSGLPTTLTVLIDTDLIVLYPIKRKTRRRLKLKAAQQRRDLAAFELARRSYTCEFW